MSIQIDRQITQKHTPAGKEFFLQNSVDTVKSFQAGVKTYTHFDGEDVQTFHTKKVLRRALSRESGGAWIEEKEGKMRYFIDDSGWFNASFKEVSKEECFQSPSTMQKVLGLGLGILALAPAVNEFVGHMSFGTKEAAMGLVVLNQKSPFLGILGCGLISSEVDAQAVGTEFQLNTNAINNQTRPNIAGLTNGGFIAVWQSSEQDGDDEGIFGQQYNSLGQLVGAEFQINNHSQNAQQYPVVAAIKSGGFVVVWDSFGQDGDSWGVFGQRFSENGTSVGLEFQANTYFISDQKFCNVASLENGGFAVFWNSQLQDSSGSGIFGQKYDEQGQRIGTEFLVNTYTTSNQPDPNAAGFSDGGFVVVWESHEQDGDSWGVFGQRYRVDGVKRGLEFPVNTYVVGSQNSPSVASLETGKFVVVWQSVGQDGDQGGVYRRIFGADGVAEEGGIRVNDNTQNNQGGQVVEADRGGGFIVIWTSMLQDGSQNGVFGKRYNSSGSNLTSDFQVNTYVDGVQGGADLASLQNNDFVVVWQSEGQDGDGFGIFGQRYNANGTKIPLTYPISMNTSVLANSTLPTSTVSNHFSSSISDVQSEMESSSIYSSLASSQMIPSVIEIIYGESYSITQNGQTIGTFTISGGSGLYSGSNPNILEIQLDPDFQLQDEDTLTLFSVPDGEPLQWEGIILSSECFGAEGEQVFNEETSQNDYQIIFHLDEDSCLFYTGAMKYSAIPVLTGGGLI